VNGKPEMLVQIVGEQANFFRLRAFGSAHAEGQADDDFFDLVVADELSEIFQIGAFVLAVKGFQALRCYSQGIGDGDADAAGANVEAEDARNGHVGIIGSAAGRGLPASAIRLPDLGFRDPAAMEGRCCATISTTTCYKSWKELFMRRSVRVGSSRRQPRSGIRGSSRLSDVMVIAEQEGLLTGARTLVVRGRMPEALVARAKKRTGIDSDTDLIQVALANIAVEDDYADWLLSRRGAVSREADLEF